MTNASDDVSIITATEASRSFSELLHRVCYGGESFLIKKGNRLMARIAPVEIVPQPQETIPTIPIEKPALDMSTETLERPLTQEEAEFFDAWMEQVRKVVP